MSHKVVKSVSPERWLKSTWFQAVSTKLTAEWHAEIPWLNGAHLPTHLLPAVKKGYIAAFQGVPCPIDLLIPARPAATAGRLWLRLCSSCAPCLWVMRVDFLTTFHLALKLPSFWAVWGDRFHFDSVPLRGSHPQQLRQWGSSSRWLGFGKLLVAVHTQSLCSPQTHAMWREVPWNQMPQGGWDLLPSVPGKLKLFSFHKGRNICDLVGWRKICLYMFIPGSVLTRPQDVLQAYKANMSLSSVDKVYQSILKKTFLPFNVLHAGYCQ